MRELGADIIIRSPEGFRLFLKIFDSSLLNCNQMTNDDEYIFAFDHDLGRDDESGLTLLRKFLTEICPYEESINFSIQLVSSNPVGLQNMKNLLCDKGFYSEDGTNFYMACRAT